MIVQIRAFQDEDGTWCATGVDHGIHTQGSSLDDLFANIDEAAKLHFEDDLAAGRTIDLLIIAQKEFAGAPASGHGETVCGRKDAQPRRAVAGGWAT